MISFLCPTRGREALLRASLASIRDHATGREPIEVLLGVDDDDPIDYAPIVLDFVDAGVFLHAAAFRAPRVGYVRLHETYNRLAMWSVGDELVLWNDDARIATPDFDATFRGLRRRGPHGTGGAHYIAALANPDGFGWAFPILSRAAYEAIGVFSEDRYNDSWLGWVGTIAGIYAGQIPVSVRHEGVADQTFAEGGGSDFPLDQDYATIVAAARKIRSAMAAEVDFSRGVDQRALARIADDVQGAADGLKGALLHGQLYDQEQRYWRLRNALARFDRFLASASGGDPRAFDLDRKGDI